MKRTSKSSFKEATWRALSTYRTTNLGIESRGEFKGTLRDHILPGEGKENILPSIRDTFWKWLPSQQIKLHKYFHHLNSSQAACFNLFFPFIRHPHEMEVLVRCMGLPGSPSGIASFEYVPDPEEGTNIDFMLQLKSGAKIIFEFKYTEDGFARAREDAEHLKKFATIYLNRVSAKLQLAYCDPKQFLANYQLARNVLHLGAHAEDALVFLIPRANPCFHAAQSTLDALVRPELRQRVRLIYLEDLIDSLERELHSVEVRYTAKYVSHISGSTGA